MQDVPLIKMADKPPAKIPGHVERIPTPLSSPKQTVEFEIPHKLSEDEANKLDQECHERFIKVNVKHITDGQVRLYNIAKVKVMKDSSRATSYTSRTDR